MGVCLNFFYFLHVLFIKSVVRFFFFNELLIKFKYVIIFNLCQLPINFAMLERKKREDQSSLSFFIIVSQTL